MWEGIEVLERQVAAVANGIEGGENSRPVGRAVQKEAEGIEIELVDFLAVFLEMDVLNSFSQERDPVLGEVILHDVAGIEVDLHVFARKLVDKGIHLLWTM